MFYLLGDGNSIWLVCFIGGFMDAAGYVKLKRLFVVSVTGNLIVASASIYHPYVDVLPRMVVLLTFLLSVVFTTTLIIRIKIVEEWSSRSSAILLFLLEIAMIVAAIVCGLLLEDSVDSASNIMSVAIVLVGCLMSFAMGIHVTAVKECMPSSPNTALMTMNSITLTINACVFMHYYMARHCKQRFIMMHPRTQRFDNVVIRHRFKGSSKKLWKSATPLICFIAGAITGAIMILHFSFWSLMVPVAILLVMVIDIYSGYCKRGGTVTRPWFDQEHYYVGQYEQVPEPEPAAESSYAGVEGTSTLVRALSHVSLVHQGGEEEEKEGEEVGMGGVESESEDEEEEESSDEDDEEEEYQPWEFLRHRGAEKAAVKITDTDAQLEMAAL